MNCPVCKNETTVPHYRWPKFTTLLCSACGFEFIDTEQASYPANAQYVYDEPIDSPPKPEQSHVRRRIQDVLRFAKPPGRCLDIGCGKGEVSLLLAQKGFHCVGIDMKAHLIGYLQREQPNVTWYCAQLDELESLEREAFDVITMYHALEHMSDPVGVLRRLARFGKPGTLFAVEVPNLGGLEARLKGQRWHYYTVDHVNYFRLSDLREVARRAGLEFLGARGYQHFSYPQDVLWKDAIKGALALIGFQDVLSVFLRIADGSVNSPSNNST